MITKSRSNYPKRQKVVYTLRCLMKDIDIKSKPNVFVSMISFYYDEKAVRHSLQSPRYALVYEDPSGTTMMGQYMCRIMGAKHVHYGNMLLNSVIALVDDFDDNVLLDKYNACVWASRETREPRRSGSKAVLSRRKPSHQQQTPTW